MEGWGWRRVHHPDHVDRVVTRLQRSWETGTPWEDTFPLRRHDGEYCWFLSRASPVRDDKGRVLRWVGSNTDITELREADERQKLLVDELNHRVKNTLAAVQSLARQSARNAASIDDFMQRFEPRLLARSRTHSLMACDKWQGANLTAVISETLAPFAQGAPGRVEIFGPAVWLGPTAAVTLAMAMHELATDAAKYGCLSVPQGRVSVTWNHDLGGGTQPALDLLWEETNGPHVAPLKNRGFGSRLIEQGVKNELNGEARLELSGAGAKCGMRLPLSSKVALA